MIKIQDHLNRDDIEDFIENQIENLWDFLNPKKVNGDFKADALISKCKKYYNIYNEESYLINYANNSKSTASRHRRFLKYLFKLDNLNLKRIIKAKPEEFENLNTEILQILLPEDIFYTSGATFKQTNFGKLLSDKIFSYINLRKSEFCKELLGELNFDRDVTCPYCNSNLLQIVNLVNESNKNIAFLDLDHFYPKVRFPFFAVSFYNLIPSCHDCNSRLKKDKLFTVNTHIHPYLESFDDCYRFNLKAEELILNSEISEIEVENLGIKEDFNSLRDLKILDRFYNSRTSIKENRDYYRKYYAKYKNTPEIEMFKDYFRDRLAINKNEILKKPFSKLNRDVIKQIDIDTVLEID